jgi:hypothetical protein
MSSRDKLVMDRIRKPRALLYWLVTVVGTAGACRMDYGYLSEGSPMAGASGEAGTESSGGSDGFGGSGGSAAESAGGSSGSGGSGGSESDAGSDAAAGMSAAGMVGEPRTAIVSEGGRIVPDSNDFGIDGEWRIFGADTQLLMPTFDKKKVCVKGTILGVKGGDFGRYWGGGLQLVLHNASAGGSPLPYDAKASGLAGLVFEILGPMVPPRIRLKFKMAGTNDSYCRNVEAVMGDDLDLAVAEALHNCWMPGGAPVDATNLENFEVHIVPEDPVDIPIDFCVTALTAIPLVE